jgi:hypothetical protein
MTLTQLERQLLEELRATAEDDRREAEISINFPRGATDELRQRQNLVARDDYAKHDALVKLIDRILGRQDTPALNGKLDAIADKLAATLARGDRALYTSRTQGQAKDMLARVKARLDNTHGKAWRQRLQLLVVDE